MKILSILAVLILLIAPAAYAGGAATSVSVTTGSYPEISVNTSSGNDISVSYSYLLLTLHLDGMGFGSAGAISIFGANLEKVNWNIKQAASVTYFNSSFSLSPTLMQPLGNVSGVYDNLTSFYPQVTMSVQMGYAKNIVDTIYAQNTNNTNDSAQFTNLSQSTFYISNYITVIIPSLTTSLFGMEPSYSLQLLQQINSSINGTTPRFDGIEGQFGVTPFMGFAFTHGSTIKKSRSLFWWPENYTVNNSSKEIKAYILKRFSGVYLGFQYSANQKSSVIFQDPYFSILNETIAGLKIVNQKLHQIYQTLVDNIEYLSTGSVAGLLLIGAAYVSYRRKKF